MANRPRLGKKEIVERIAKNMEVSPAKARYLMDAVFLALEETLLDGLAKNEEKTGADLSVLNFGVFSVRVIPERLGRNPHTGEVKMVPETYRLCFSGSTALKKKIRATR